MNNIQSNKLAMYLATLSVMNENVSIWNSVPAITAQINDLQLKIQEIQQYGAAQSLNITGIAQDKKAIKAQLADQGHILASALYAYAHSVSNNELKNKVDYPLSELQFSPDETLIEHCTNFYNVGVANLQSLQIYNISSQTLSDLQQYINDFTAKLAAPRTAASNKKASTQTLNELFKATDQLLKNGLDKTIVVFKNTHPVFYNTLQSARSIIDLGSSSRYVELTVGPESHVSVQHVVIGSDLLNTGSVAVMVIGDHHSNEDGVELVPGDKMRLLLTNPTITVQNFHTSMEGKFKVRITSTAPVVSVRRAVPVTFRLNAGEHRRIENIVIGSQWHNLGPAAVTACDCSEPDCGITNDDQPCGYEQTIEAMLTGTLSTTKSFVNFSNKDTVKTTKIKVMVWQNAGPSAPQPIANS